MSQEAMLAPRPLWRCWLLHSCPQARPPPPTPWATQRGSVRAERAVCSLPAGPLASPPPSSQNTQSPGTPWTPRHPAHRKHPGAGARRGDASLRPESWASARACACLGLASALGGRMTLQPRRGPAPGIPQEGDLASCSPSSHAHSQKGPRKPHAVLWEGPRLLCPRRAVSSCRCERAPRSVWVFFFWPQTSLPGRGTPFPVAPRVLTCGCWAGSCGRPGTRSPVAAGSWRCGGRG